MIFEVKVYVRSWTVSVFVSVNCDFGIDEVFTYRKGVKYPVNKKIADLVEDRHIDTALDDILSESECVNYDN